MTTWLVECRGKQGYLLDCRAFRDKGAATAAYGDLCRAIGEVRIQRDRQDQLHPPKFYRGIGKMMKEVQWHRARSDATEAIIAQHPPWMAVMLRRFVSDRSTWPALAMVPEVDDTHDYSRVAGRRSGRGPL